MLNLASLDEVRMSEKIDLKARLKENPFILAPMAGITDNAFRNFASEMSSSVVVLSLIHI